MYSTLRKIDRTLDRLIPYILIAAIAISAVSTLIGALRLTFGV